MIKISAFKWVPPFAQGLVRDLRPRWALEEAGVPYEVKLIGRGDDQNSEDYRSKQPFGQVPVLEDGDFHLFESGAIALHIAEKSASLMSANEQARAREKAWVIAALNSVEPAVTQLLAIDLFYQNEEWAKLRRPAVLEMVKSKLESLSKWLEGRTYLEGERFTVADLIMCTVLRNLRHLDLLQTQFPTLDAYNQRCEARPAFQRALNAQLKAFEEHTPQASPN
jgi:glutathione S-transferase